MAKNNQRKSSWRQRGMFIDFLNIVFFCIIAVAAVLLFLNRKKYMLMFPVIFFAAAVMNLALGIKKYKMDQYASSILSVVAGLFLLGFSIFSLVVIL